MASHYNMLPLSAVLDAVARRRVLPPRSIMITFDDGYREVADVAWPILLRLGIPALLFVPTAYPDGPERSFWWDRLEQALDDTPRRDRIETPIGRLPLARRAQRVKACSRLKRYLNTLHHDDARYRAEALCDELDAGPGARPGILRWDDLRRLARQGATARRWLLPCGRQGLSSRSPSVGARTICARRTRFSCAASTSAAERSCRGCAQG